MGITHFHQRRRYRLSGRQRWQHFGRRQSVGNPPGAQKLQFLLSVLPLTAMNGFLLGYVVPTWHRNAEQRHRFSRGDDADDAVPTALLRFELRRQSGAPIAAQGVAPTP